MRIKFGTQKQEKARTFVIWIAVLTVKSVVPNPHICPSLAVAKLNTETGWKISDSETPSTASLIMFLMSFSASFRSFDTPAFAKKFLGATMTRLKTSS